MQRWIPTGNWLVAGIAPLLVFIATSLDRNYQTDLWHHLARGRAMVEQGQLVNQDLFTCTIHGQPIHADANWLSQLLFYGLHEVGGLELLQLVNSLLLTSTMGLLVWLCWRVSGSLRLAAGLGMFTFLGLWQVLLIRPQTFSLLLFVLMYVLLHASERRPWLLVLVPVLEVLWVNVHGAFPVGVLLVGCWFVAALVEAFRREPKASDASSPSARGETKRLFLCLLATALATLVNPYGLAIYEFVSVTSGRSSARSIEEWLPARFGSLIGVMWTLSILLTLVSFYASSRRPRGRELWLAACFLPLSFTAVRMVAWWLLAMAPVITAQLAAAVPRHVAVDEEGQKPSFFAGLFLACFVLLAIGSAPPLAQVSPVPPLLDRVHRTEHDLEAVAVFLRQHPPTPTLPHQGGGSNRCIYCRLDWGEYFTWSLAPDGYRVFMDGRIDLYPDEVWIKYLAVLHARTDWQAILDWHGVDCLVLDASHADQQVGLLAQVQHSREWRYVGAIGSARVYVRRAP